MKTLIDHIREKVEEMEDDIETIEQLVERQKCYIDPDSLAEMSRHGFNLKEIHND